MCASGYCRHARTQDEPALELLQALLTWPGVLALVSWQLQEGAGLPAGKGIAPLIVQADLGRLARMVGNGEALFSTSPFLGGSATPTGSMSTPLGAHKSLVTRVFLGSANRRTGQSNSGELPRSNHNLARTNRCASPSFKGKLGRVARWLATDCRLLPAGAGAGGWEEGDVTGLVGGPAAEGPLRPQLRAPWGPIWCRHLYLRAFMFALWYCVPSQAPRTAAMPSRQPPCRAALAVAAAVAVPAVLQAA